MEIMLGAQLENSKEKIEVDNEELEQKTKSNMYTFDFGYAMPVYGQVSLVSGLTYNFVQSKNEFTDSKYSVHDLYLNLAKIRVSF